MNLRLHLLLLPFDELTMRHYLSDLTLQNFLIFLILLRPLGLLLPFLLLLGLFLLLLLTIAIGQPPQKIHCLWIAQCQVVRALLRDLVHLGQILPNEALKIVHGVGILKRVGFLECGLGPRNNSVLLEVLLSIRVVLPPQPLQNFVTLRKHLRHYIIAWNKSQESRSVCLAQAQLLEHALLQKGCLVCGRLVAAG